MTFDHPRWPVFHEDNHLLVLYKPAGLIMQRGPADKPNLVDLAKAWLKARHAKPGKVFVGMVHRLDGPVAGVLVLARTSKAAARLSAGFRLGEVEKGYLAVVQGRPPKRSDRLAHHLVRRGRYSRPVPAGTAGSQAAALRYRVLESRSGRSLLAVTLETGRRHQIRAQLAAIGCPIWGDKAYGAARNMPYGCIALLSHELRLIHPTRQTSLRFECPLPEGWPWPCADDPAHRPLWALETYREQGWTGYGDVPLSTGSSTVKVLP